MNRQYPPHVDPSDAAAPATYHELAFGATAEDGAVRCRLCQRYCLIGEGQFGYCLTKTNRAGRLYSTIYGVVSMAGADAIEKKPVYHFRPGTRVLTVGSLGCNFRCDFCQNWEVAFADGRNSGGLAGPNLMPADVIALARDHGCQGIGWSFNEASIWSEYVLDCARLARQHGLYTVYVTNGYISEEALEILGPFLDVYRIDIKSLDTDFYRRLAHGAQVPPILSMAARARHRFGIHTEVVTNVLPGWTDQPAPLRAIGGWIASALGADTPWHLTSFVPYARMLNVPPTAPAAMRQALAIGAECGLRFVYSDSMELPHSQNTRCPECGEPLITRYAGEVTARLRDGACPACRTTIAGRWQ